MKKASSILYAVVLGFLLLIAGITSVSALGLSNSLHLFVVQSGSMEPAIKTGSIVVVRPESQYRKGDVITFKDPRKPKISITHRIYGITAKEKQISYTTKGDANKSPDSDTILPSDILGKEILSIPYLGFPVNFAKTKEWLLALIIIPATMIIYSEVLNIKNEAIRLLAERKKRKLTMKEKIEEKIGEKIIAVEKEAGKVLG